jgi:alkanesulfonate monooxygenase SsuD/methylene tetrahydromethanopterin reductase-like flavin-dependent oxidoreductase (luciferase family)
VSAITRPLIPAPNAIVATADPLGCGWDLFPGSSLRGQFVSPFPLLAAVGAKISRIEIGTAIIDMRYKNSLEIVEETLAQLV